MPKKPQRPKKRRIEGKLTIPQLNVITGNDLLDDENPFAGWDSKSVADLWFKNRVFILSLRDKQHPDADVFWYESGDRPAWFWRYEAADFRPKVSGTYNERRALIPIKRFEYLRNNNLLFKHEEKLFYRHIEKQFAHLSERWSPESAKKAMVIELNFLKKWQENESK